MNITNELIQSADASYKEFHASLIPTVSKDLVIGVRAPICKKIAKKYAKTKEGEEFMDTLPHKYHDENMVHGYMLSFLDFDMARKRLEAFLPHMNSWAIVDSTVSALKSFFKHASELKPFIHSLLKSDKEYAVRFGIVALMSYYLDSNAQESISLVKGICSDKFYIKMAQAWFFATALTKHYEMALPVIEGRELEPWVHNKAIQKARESYRVPTDSKRYLNNLKIIDVKKSLKSGKTVLWEEFK